jgi:malonyl CoA-acyl carrier protein transacylase
MSSAAMMTPEQLDEFNRNLQRELDEENRRFEKSGGPEFYSAIRPAMEDINER